MQHQQRAIFKYCFCLFIFIIFVFLLVISNKNNDDYIFENVLLGDAGGPSIFGATTTYAASGASTMHTFSHTIASGGSNTALIVAVYTEGGNNTAITSATWNGTSMTKIVNIAGVQVGGGVMFFLAAPETGTYNIVITTQNYPANAVAFNLEDVAQSSPVDATAANANGSSATLASSSVTTTQSKSLVIGWGLIFGTATGITQGSGQTLVAKINDGGSNNLAVSIIQKATAGFQSSSFSWTNASVYDIYVTSLKYESAEANTITITDLTDNRIYQRNDSEEANITITGTYTGSPTYIQARVVNDGTSDEVVTWTNIDTSPAGGTFSGAITTPQGGWYNAIVRFSNDETTISSGTNAFAVGMIVGLTGQSQSVNWFGQGTSMSASSTTMVYNGSWTASTLGTSSIAFSNKIHNKLGNVPVAFIDGAVNGSIISSWEPGDDNYENFITKVDAVGSDIEYIIWNQGETDANGGTSEATYESALGTLMSNFRASTTHSKTGNLPVLVSILGRLTSYATDAQQQNIRNAQFDACASDNDCYIGAQMIDVGLVDGIHWDSNGYLSNGQRMAQTVLYLLGEETYYRGSTISSYTLIDGSTYDINLTHYGGSDFTPTTGITGFSVTGETISSVNQQSANTIRIVIVGSDSTPEITYLYGNADVSGDVFDNSTMVLPIEFNMSISEYVAPVAPIYPTIIFK